MNDYTCKDCMFYEQGLCHRNPPTLVYSETRRQLLTLYPCPSETDWCGEYQDRPPEPTGHLGSYGDPHGGTG